MADAPKRMGARIPAKESAATHQGATVSGSRDARGVDRESGTATGGVDVAVAPDVLVELSVGLIGGPSL
jgi:hypothetical protein